MARKCKACGEEMTYRVGEHYRDTGRGQVLYKGVRRYTCPNGCTGAYYDYRDARPAAGRERIFGFIPAPRRQVNVVDPLLAVGLVVFAAMLVFGFLATTMTVAAKTLAVIVVVTFTIWLMVSMGESVVDDPSDTD